MIEVKIPKEIRNYKEKLFFGLNLRQILCTIIALGINIPLYFALKEYLSADLVSWIIIGIALPIFLIGYFNYNGMPFEQFVACIFRFMFLTPQRRKYKTDNLFAVLAVIHRKEVRAERKKQNSLFYRLFQKKGKKKNKKASDK